MEGGFQITEMTAAAAARPAMERIWSFHSLTASFSCPTPRVRCSYTIRSLEHRMDISPPDLIRLGEGSGCSPPLRRGTNQAAQGKIISLCFFHSAIKDWWQRSTCQPPTPLPLRQRQPSIGTKQIWMNVTPCHVRVKQMPPENCLDTVNKDETHSGEE